MIVIVKHDNNNLITNIYTSNNPKSLIKKLGLEEQEYKIFPIDNINFKNGGDIRKFNDNSTLKSISEQVELGLVTIAEDEILENDIIRKLTEIEQIEQDLIPMPSDKEIITNEDGTKELILKAAPIDQELLEVEKEIQTIEQEAYQSLIQDRINGTL